MMRRMLALGAALILGAARSEAQQQVSFAPASAASAVGVAVPDSIPATLSLPHSMTSMVPAVVIVYASAGLLPNGPEPCYVAALNKAGIATLVIDMWAARGIPAGPEAFGGTGGADRRPKLPRDALPDAFRALKFLAAKPAIDAQRIGILGFSWGAAVSVLAAIEANAEGALGLSFPKITSGRIDDANWTRLVWRRWPRTVGRLVVAVRPCPTPMRARLVIIERIQGQDPSQMPSWKI